MPYKFISKELRTELSLALLQGHDCRSHSLHTNYGLCQT